MDEMGSNREKLFYAKYGKRIFDLCLSAIGLIILSPLFLIVIIIICINSRGGPFYVQSRYGQGMTVFSLIKFRTMVDNSIGLKKEFEPGNNARVTKIGEILRKTKIDELPELTNVFLGEMSIIGPRPEVEKYVQVYPQDFEEILKIRPGLSDLASIKYRDEESILTKLTDPDEYYRNVILPDKLYLAKQYIKTISFKSDLSIIGNTLKSILKIPS